MLAALAARVDPQDLAASRRPAATEAAPPAPVTVLAPQKPAVATDNFKPAPEGFDLRRAQPSEPSGDDVSENSDPTTPDQRLRAFAAGFDRIEQRQIAALNGLRAPAAAKAERLREAFAEAGLPVDRMVQQAALPKRTASRRSRWAAPMFRRPNAAAISSAPTLASTSPSPRWTVCAAPCPLRRCASPCPACSTSHRPSAIARTPSLASPALHTGIDFRGEYGDPVRATAAGRVDRSPAPAGGYGNMVEIDHGAGLTTRYGHLSRLFVEDGQWVKAGAELGAIGSTGRSTGPHLHYEVRVDGAPVDPSRYLKAGKLLNAGL